MKKTKALSRVNFSGIVFSCIGIMIIFQLVHIQNSSQHQKLGKEASQTYTYEKQVIYPERGNIYDRYGRLLAGNEEVYEAGVLLQYVKNPETIANTFSGIPGVNFEDTMAAASLKFDPQKRIYALISDFLPGGVVNALARIKKEYENSNPYGENPNLPSLRGVVWYPHLMRSYPENTLASNVIGFYKFRDRKNGRGFYGVEEFYDSILSGPPVEVSVPLNPYLIEEIPELPAGASLVLTIDREIQAMVEAKLDEAVEHHEANSGTVIILNPRNGEILAMASQPRINLNQYWEFEDEFKDTTPFNRAISQTYEPGSVFKVLTMAAALDSGTVKEDTKFNDPGIFKYGGGTFYNWNRRAWGEQTMQTCMQNSLNVCLAWVATEMGKEDFYSYIQAFGIGRRTNVDLGGEKTWPLTIPGNADWYPINLATNSFGQGVAVTPLQMAVAISSVANGGKMMKPHVVKAIISDEQQYTTSPQVLGVPISPKTADTLNNMLVQSLEQGEAKAALVPGYRIAGKTGTAEIPEEGNYGIELTNATFVGWGPADDPQFLVYVWIEKPNSSPWGSTVAAPIFRDIVLDLVRLMDIPPDEMRNTLFAQGLESNDSIQ